MSRGGRGLSSKTMSEMPRIRALRSQGASINDISKATGLSATAVANAIGRLDDAGGTLVDMSLIPRYANGCVDVGGVNPVDGFKCSRCGAAVTVVSHDVDADTMEPDWDVDCECIPRYCPNCGRRIDWKGAE